jgi:hypothetical protein
MRYLVYLLFALCISAGVLYAQDSPKPSPAQQGVIRAREVRHEAALRRDAPVSQARQTTYNGHWWLLLTSEEQSGYLNGDADCHSFELKSKARYSKSFADEEEEVTNFYRNKPDELVLPVFDAIRIAEELPPLRKAKKGGEVWNEPHGYWDGQWWREGTPADRIGFVEGYLACYQLGARNARASFSKSAAEYVALINEWYRLNEETGDVDQKKVETKIANVLFKFRDHS